MASHTASYALNQWWMKLEAEDNLGGLGCNAKCFGLDALWRPPLTGGAVSCS
jgi:hypothetical protein